MEKPPNRRIAVIPARGGSKRLPGKALIKFDGKPMIAHTIEAAQRSNSFSKIVVSSDSQEILEVGACYGASRLQRDAKLCDDQTTTAPVLIDALDHEEASGQYWDVLVCLYATAPLRNAADIVAVTQMIEPGICDYAMAVCEADRPVHQALSYLDDGSMTPVWPDSVNQNAAKDQRYLFGNGSTYAVSVSAFRSTRTLYGPGLRGYEMPRERSVDLNTEDDLALLTYYLKRQERS